MALTLELLIAVALILYLIKLQCAIPKNFPPGLPRLPLWGSYWILLWKNYQLSHEAITTIGKNLQLNIYSFYLGNFPTVVGMDYESCREILTKPGFEGRASGAYINLLARGNSRVHGIILADSTYWQDQRRFTQRGMRDFGLGRRMTSIENFTEREVLDLIEFLKRKPSKDDADVCLKPGIIEMPDILYGVYLACIWSIITVRPFTRRELRDVGRAAFRFQRSTDALGGAMNLTPWLRFIAPEFFGYNSAVNDNNELYDFCDKVIQESIDSFSEDNTRDFIDLYLHEMKDLEKNIITTSSYSRKQLVYNIIDSMFPAATGIGHTTNFLFAYFLNQPDIPRKIQNEIDSVVGRSRLPTIDDRQHMPYTQAVLREILRKQPVNPLGIARTSIEDSTLGGYFIPKNTILLANLWSAHHDPNVYTNPQDFIAERWLDENGALTKHDPTTLTFGAGRRLCLGETFAKNTMFLTITGLLQHFDFVLPQGEPMPDPNAHVPGINMSIKNYKIQAVERQN